MNSSRRRRVSGFIAGSVVLGVSASVLAVVPPAAGVATVDPVNSTPGSGTENSSTGESRTDNLLVWATFDGDTPLVSARVRIFDGGGRSGVGRQITPTPDSSRQTDQSGLVVLRVDELPQDFTVIADQGKAKGEEIRGRMVAQVRDFSATQDIAYVNPVTTLADSWLREDRGISVGQADRASRRELRIPSWMDSGMDLRRSDRWFDGDRYVREVRRQGSISEVNAELVQALASPRDRATFRERAAEHSVTVRSGADRGAPFGERLASLDYQGLFKELIGAGVSGDPSELGKKLAQEAGMFILGYILDEWGLKDLKDILMPEDAATKAVRELKRVQEQLTDLGANVDAIKEMVAENAFTTAWSATTDLRGHIDHASESLAAVLLLDPKQRRPGSPKSDRQLKAEDLQAFISDKLVSARKSWGVALEKPPFGDNVLTAAAKVIYNQPFFSARSNVQQQRVYDILANYQLQAALLLKNWNQARGYSDTYVTHEAALWSENVTRLDQAADTLIKPSPPTGTVIDRKSRRMWGPIENSRGGNVVFPAWIAWHQSSCSKHCWGTLNQTGFHQADQKWLQVRKRMDEAGLYGSYSDWRPATISDLSGKDRDGNASGKGLWESREGRSPQRFLTELNATMGERLTKSKNSFVWPADSFRLFNYPLLYYWFGASWFDLRTGTLEETSIRFQSWGDSIFTPWGADYVRDGQVNKKSPVYQMLDRLSANVLYYRELTAAEVDQYLAK